MHKLEVKSVRLALSGPDPNTVCKPVIDQRRRVGIKQPKGLKRPKLLRRRLKRLKQPQSLQHRVLEPAHCSAHFCDDVASFVTLTDMTLVLVSKCFMSVDCPCVTRLCYRRTHKIESLKIIEWRSERMVPRNLRYIPQIQFCNSLSTRVSASLMRANNDGLLLLIHLSRAH